MSDEFVNPTRLVTAAFTRPADTTTYAVGDAMGAGVAGCILQFAGALPPNAKSGKVVTARLAKDSTGVVADSFRLLLFRRTPTVNPDDNAAPTTSFIKFADRASFVGMIDFEVGDVHADGIFYEGQDYVPSSGIPFHADGSQNPLFGLLTALGAYVPVSGEIFHIQLEVSAS